MRVTAPSTCSWLDHPVSGLKQRTKKRPVQTRFRCASTYRLKLAAYSKSLTHYTKGTPSPHEGAPTACTHTVSGSISLPSPGFFSPFPHGTGSLSVGQEYLALEDGPPMFRQGFTCPALLTFHRHGPFAYWAVTIYGQSFQTAPLEPNSLLGCSPFARRYSGNLG